MTDGNAWPQVGRIQTDEQIGTGFIAGPRHVITAFHVVAEAERVELHLSNQRVLVLRRVEHPVERWMSMYDIAVLMIEGEEELPAPLPCGHVPERLPLPYETWGCRVLGGGGNHLLSGRGAFVARLPEPNRGLLQLETKDQVQGMSGAPLAIRRSPPLVVAIGTHAHEPEGRERYQELALGTPLERLPERVLTRLGGLQTYPRLAPDREALLDRLEAVRGTEERSLRKIHYGIVFALLTLALVMSLARSEELEAFVLMPGVLGAFCVLCVLYLLSIYKSTVSCQQTVQTLSLLAAAPDEGQEWAFTFATILRHSKCDKLMSIKDSLHGS